MTAPQIAQKIFDMDYHSAQLRLIHTAPLREGDHDAERLRTIVGHLQQVADTAAALVPHVAALTPTVTIEAASPQAEKDTKDPARPSQSDGQRPKTND